MVFVLKWIKNPLLILVLLLSLSTAFMSWRSSVNYERAEHLEQKLSLQVELYKAEVEKAKVRATEAEERAVVILRKPSRTPPSTIQGLNEWFAQPR